MAITTYNTISGDTWDMIAYKVYEDCSMMHLLMEANPEALNYFVFPANVTLTIPELPEEQTDVLPEWRT